MWPDPLDPIKPMGVGVIWSNNLLITSQSYTPHLTTMSLVNSCVFEQSMGHHIS